MGVRDLGNHAASERMNVRLVSYIHRWNVLNKILNFACNDKSNFSKSCFTARRACSPTTTAIHMQVDRQHVRPAIFRRHFVPSFCGVLFFSEPANKQNLFPTTLTYNNVPPLPLHSSSSSPTDQRMARLD